MSSGIHLWIEGLAGGGALAWFVWAAVRVWALLRVQPLWSNWVGGSWQFLSAAFAAAFALTLLPMAQLPAQWPGAEHLVLGIGYELLLGSVVGLWVALPQHAAIGAGAVSAEGLSMRAGSPAFVHLWTALTVAMGFALMTHHAALEALAATFTRWPPFEPAAVWDLGARDFASVSDLWADLGLSLHAATLLALALATPVLLTRAVLSPALLSAARAPQPGPDFDRAWREWAIALPTLIALGAAWATFPSAWATALG